MGRRVGGLFEKEIDKEGGVEIKPKPPLMLIDNKPKTIH